VLSAKRGLRFFGNMAVNYLNSVPKLMGRENYADWAFAVQNVFILEGLSKCLDGSETDTVMVSKAKAKVILTLDSSLFIHVKNTSTAKEVWDKLKKLYEDSGFARKIGLLRKLISLRLDNCESMENYVNQVIDTSQKLERCGFQLSQELIGSLMLAGLTDKFEPMVIAIEHAGIDVTADSIKSRLLDMHIGGADSQSAGAFASSTFSRGARGGASRSIAGRRFGKEHRGGASSGLKKDLRDVTCFKCKKTGHFMNKCPEVKKNEDSSNAFNAVFLTGNFNNTDWYVDSGCSVHLTSRKDWLENVNKDVPVKEITVANNTRLAIAGSGDVQITTTIAEEEHSVRVSNVLYVPNLMTNLLSVSQLIKNDNKVIFHKQGCDIYNKSGQLIAQANLVDNVYKLNFKKSQINLAGLAVSAEVWHRRFGHLNYRDLNSMKNGLVNGLEFKGSMTKSEALCEVCCEGKQSRLPFSHKGNRADYPLEVIHGDLCGPMEVTSLGGSRYFMVLEDDYTRMVFAYFLRGKNEAFDKFQEFKNFVENQRGNKIKIFRTDQGSEFNSNNFKDFYKKHGILHQETNVYTPQQNGMSERMNRTLVEKARCLLYDAKLEKLFWAEALATAVYLRNRSAVSDLETTPYEKWHGRKPDVSQIRIFGSKGMVLVPKEKRLKWDEKSKRMFLVGFSDHIKGYRMYDPDKKKIVISRDVVLEEIANPGKQFLFCEPQESTDSVGVEVNSLGSPDQSFSETDSDGSYETVNSQSDEDFVVKRGDDILQIENCGTRRSQRTIKPKQFDDYVTYACIQDIDVNLNGDPESVEQAMSRTDAELWKEAMTEEVKCFEANEAWELVDGVPDSSTVVPCKWVFKTKVSDTGEVKYRARLVAKGCVQKAGIDYNEVFAPVVRHSTLRLLVSMAVQLDLNIIHLDVKTAFLNGFLEQPVYMKQPEGFVIKNSENKVYKLKKAVYGLKQASRSWNARVNEVLSNLGYIKSKYEYCLFIKKDKNSLTLVALYVDDFFVFSNNVKEVECLKLKLGSEFDIKDLGEAKQCLGVKITRDHNNNVIYLDQESYVDQVLKNFGMDDCKVVSTPIESKVEKVTNNIDVDLSNLPYQKLIGSLMYLAVLTRPDITFAVNYLSQFNNCYSEYHWQCAKRVLRYLKGTKCYKLCFSKDNVNDLHLEGFVDSDWANDSDRKSYSGYVFKLSGGPISWQSCKQKSTALSSTEAEYIGLCEASKEAVYLKNLLNELVGFNSSVTVYNDNQSAQKLATNPVFHKRSKHIDVKYHFVRECVSNNVINIKYQQTNEMVADILTKGLSRIKHSYFVKKLGIVS